MVRPAQNGFSLLEVVVAIGILAILGGSLMPMAGRTLEASKTERVKRKLLAIKEALDEYFWQVGTSSAGFPTTLTDNAFLNVFLEAGIDNTAVKDDFSDAGASGFQYLADNTNKPFTAYVWSVGPNGVSDGGGDDIWIVVGSEPVARRKTELRLNIISFAYARKMMTASARPSMGPWSAAACTDATCARVKIDLGNEFANDGFGMVFAHYRAATYLQGCVQSFGPDQTINASRTVDSIGTGDDIRQ